VNLTLSSAWQLTIMFTVATGILGYLFRDVVKLGLRTITTWRAEPLNEIYIEHGRSKVWMSLIWLMLGFNHIACLMIFWVAVVAWTLGYYVPYQ